MAKSKSQARKTEDSYEAIRRRAEARIKTRGEFLTHTAIFAGINAVLWLVWLSGLNFGWVLPWPLMLTLGWGSGWAAHAVEALLHPKNRPGALNAAVGRELALLYGEEWRLDIADRDFAAARKRAEKRIGARNGFLQHAAVYACINALVWLLWLSGLSLGFAWPLAVSGLWGLGLVGHGLDVFSGENNEKRLQREIEREMQRSGVYSKRKNKLKNEDVLADERNVRLTDDGELVEYVLDNEDETAASER